MIIVNKEKTNIINFDKVSNIYVRKNCVEYQCPDIEDFYGILGVYETEERAIEILYEIIEAYRNISNDTHFTVYEMPII